jgi:hypothetical protein
MKNQLLPCSIILALLIPVMLIAAGCIGADYVANRDIVIVHLLPDGNTGWTRLIDTGYDDSANDFLQTRDGGYLIAAHNTSGKYGPSNSRLIRLLPDGTILWDRLLDNPSYGEQTSLVQLGTGDFAVLNWDGSVIRLDSEGTIRWRTDTGITEARSITGTADGGFAAAGIRQDSIPFGSVPVFDANGNVSSRPPLANETVVTPGCQETMLQAGDRQIPVTQCTVPVDIIRQATLVKLDGDGNLIWQRAYGSSGVNSAWSVAEAPDSSGFLVTGYESVREEGINRTNTLAALLLDPDGRLLHVTRIDRINYFESTPIRPIPGGYAILYINTTLPDGYNVNRPAEVHLGEDGSITCGRILDASVVTTWAPGGGYISAGFSTRGRSQPYDDAVYGSSDTTRLHAVKLTADGSTVWDREIAGVAADSVKKIIPTSDGGYTILALKENR